MAIAGIDSQAMTKKESIKFFFLHLAAVAFMWLSVSSGYSQTVPTNDSRRRDISPDSGSQSQDAQALVRQGQEYLRNRQFNEAMDVLRRAIEVQPNLGAAHVQLGLTLLAVGRTDQALAEMKRAIELDPNDAHAYVGLGNVEGAMRRYAGCPCGDDRSSMRCIASRAFICITNRMRNAIGTT